MESKPVIYQPNGLPQCPVCEKPTTMQPDGFSCSTAAYYQPRIAPDGTNLNPDRNTVTTGYSCCDCGCYFSTCGNAHDGFLYGNIIPKEPPGNTEIKGGITFNGVNVSSGTDQRIKLPTNIIYQQDKTNETDNPC